MNDLSDLLGQADDLLADAPPSPAKVAAPAPALAREDSFLGGESQDDSPKLLPSTPSMFVDDSLDDLLGS